MTHRILTFVKHAIAGWVIFVILYLLTGCAESGLYPMQGKSFGSSADTGITSDTAAYASSINDTAFYNFNDDIDNNDAPGWQRNDNTEDEVIFMNIAPMAVASAEGSLFEYGEWALNDNSRAIGWYSEPQYFTWNSTWVQLQWEENWNVTLLDIYWDDDLFAAEIEIFYQPSDGIWIKWNEYADYESITGNFSRFLLAKNINGILIKMEGSSNMLSTYSIKEIEVTGAQY